jgi:four helix bundle protein
MYSETTSIQFNHLPAWKRSLDLAVAVHSVLKFFPKDLQDVICCRLLQAAVSIPARVAEGSQNPYKQGEHILRKASFALTETETLLYVLFRLGYLPHEQQKYLAELSADLRDDLNSMLECFEANRI